MQNKPVCVIVRFFVWFVCNCLYVHLPKCCACERVCWQKIITHTDNVTPYYQKKKKLREKKNIVLFRYTIKNRGNLKKRYNITPRVGVWQKYNFTWVHTYEYIQTIHTKTVQAIAVYFILVYACVCLYISINDTIFSTCIFDRF